METIEIKSSKVQKKEGKPTCSQNESMKMPEFYPGDIRKQKRQIKAEIIC